MRPPRLLLAFLLSLGGSGCATAQEGDFAVVTTFVTPAGEIEAVNYFFGDHVVETTEGEADAVFDLADMSWRGLAGPDEGMTVTLQQAEEWAAASLAMSDSSALAAQPEAVASFVRAMLYPEFEMTESGDTLVFENAALRYEVQESIPLTAEFTRRYYAYDELNAYRKAMLMRQFPPFAQLLVSDSLAARQVLPTSLALTVRTPQGETQMNLRVRVEDVEPGEVEALRALVPQ